MKTKWLLIFFLFSFCGFAQEIKAEWVETTPLKVDHFVGVDKYGSRYTIQKNVLYKKTKDREYSFSSLGLGEISQVDILNPLKIVLFYKDLNTVVLLDDRLNEIKRIRFNELSEFRMPEFVSKADKNSLWLFNADTGELEIYDYQQQKVLARTQPLGNKPIAQQANFNECWLLTVDKLSRYNIYGSFMEDYKVEGFKDISFYNQYLIALKDSALVFLDYRKKRFYPIDLPTIQIQNFYTAHENLYIYDGENLHHFSLNYSN